MTYDILNWWNDIFPTLLSWIHGFNAFAWISANYLIAYISILVVAFAIYYPIVFDPSATTVGKYIFRFFFSLVGVIGLIFVSLYIDPAPGRSPDEYPGDVLLWRPGLRLFVYGYLAYSITALVAVLVIRKYWPDKLRTALDVKVREHHHNE